MNDTMSFPKTIDEFLDDYSFKDKEEAYTNGSMLIPTFRVWQGVEHYLQELNNVINRQKTEIKELCYDKIIAERHEKDARDLFADCVKQLNEARAEIERLETELKRMAPELQKMKEAKA